MATLLFSFMSETIQESQESLLKLLGNESIIAAQKNITEVRDMNLGIKTEDNFKSDYVDLESKIKELQEKNKDLIPKVSQKNVIIEILLDEISSLKAGV